MVWQCLSGVVRGALLTHVQVDARVTAGAVRVQSGHAVRRKQIGQPDAQAGQQIEQALPKSD